MDNHQVIAQTKNWITEVVIGCNFCPFASQPVKQNRVYYHVSTAVDIESCLLSFMEECQRLDNDENIETTMLILPNAVSFFEEYLVLVELAEQLLVSNGYEGVYQVASFHPLYQFAGTSADDAANYTNRSIYPMLHLLREESIEQALQRYPDPEQIPEKNIRFAHKKGLTYMKMLRDSCI
jgi:hypothetical protein